MDVTDVFMQLEELGREAGVCVYIADRDPETGSRGFGIGMHAAQKRFMCKPGPALVLGAESGQVLVRRGFGAFLELPCIRYLELPFTREELQRAAAQVCGVGVDAAALDGVRESVTAHCLESIRLNVTHRLKGVTLSALNQAVAASRRVTVTTGLAARASGLLSASVVSLASSDRTIRESLAVLDWEIGVLGGIGPPKVSAVLRIQRARLGAAADDLARFVTGITAWTHGELGAQSLGQLVEIGAGVSRTFGEAASAFTRLSTGGGEGAR
jgi:hypothetical protein